MELTPESQQSTEMLRELLRQANIGGIDQHYCVALHEAVEAIEKQAWIENDALRAQLADMKLKYNTLQVEFAALSSAAGHMEAAYEAALAAASS